MSAPLVWLHLSSDRQTRAAETLAQRLDTAQLDLSYVTTLSHPGTRRFPARLNPRPEIQDRRADAQQFLRATDPALAVVWCDALPQHLLAEADTAGVPLLLVGGRAHHFDIGGMPWAKWRMSRCLRRFRRILVENDAAATRVTALGARPWVVEVSGDLEEASPIPPHSEAERLDLSETLATRPVWFAADVPLGEAEILLEAHEEALRRAHRFLLVISPADLGESDALAAMVTRRGLRVARRSDVDDIDRELQVLIVDITGEHGLWYRLCPLTFFGGTLTGAENRDPFEAGALGSAVVYGPRILRHGANFERLRGAKAARAIGRGEDLGAALAALSAPDQSALLAGRAWEVTSRGAQATDRLVELVTELLEDRP
ncbi:MAG: glycosyltransferase N-terminal domain-containing protein [Pseudomonadota bacterium]